MQHISLKKLTKRMKSISLRGEIHLLARLLFCRFWPIKQRVLSHVLSAALIVVRFFFYHSFYGMTLDSTQMKVRGYIFKSIIVCKRLAEFFFFFFNWKLNIPSFIFLIWMEQSMEQSWIWFSQKLTKTVKISIVI